MCRTRVAGSPRSDKRANDLTSSRRAPQTRPGRPAAAPHILGARMGHRGWVEGGPPLPLRPARGLVRASSACPNLSDPSAAGFDQRSTGFEREDQRTYRVGKHQSRVTARVHGTIRRNARCMR